MAPAPELQQAALAAPCLAIPEENVAIPIALHARYASFSIAKYVGAKINAIKMGPRQYAANLIPGSLMMPNAGSLGTHKE
ncbi:MAG: hypothetical protein KGQ35_12205 [Burkholderiales bacterium]|nr:hypothetical protein [Burkholderiales bacterium]